MLGAHLTLTRYEVHIAVTLHDVVLIAVAIVPAHFGHKIRDRTAKSAFTTNAHHTTLLAFALALFGLFFGSSALALPFASPLCGRRSIAAVGVVGAFIRLAAAVGAAVVAAASLQQAPLSAFAAGCAGGTSATTTPA